MHALLSERCNKMKETNIRKYAELMKELGLTGLEITEENSKVRLERSLAAPAEETLYSVPGAAANMQTAAGSKDYISVKSPIVGIFYTAPGEGEAPFVSVGDRVKKGQTLGIVEAMKLMHEITCEQNGIVKEICAQNGDAVEYGQKLFIIEEA